MNTFNVEFIFKSTEQEKVALLEQSDIVPVLKSFNFTLEGEELTVDNPPSFKLDEFDDAEDS